MPRAFGPSLRRSLFSSVTFVILCSSISIAKAAKVLPGKHGAVGNIAVGNEAPRPPRTATTQTDPPPQPPPHPPLVPGAIVRVDLSCTSPTPPLLWGLFIEEIQHAGEGGLYAELLQDRSFGGTARALGVGEATGKVEGVVPPCGVPWLNAMRPSYGSADAAAASAAVSAADEEARGGESSAGRGRGGKQEQRHRFYRPRAETAGSSSVGDDGPVPGSGLPPAWSPLSEASVVTLVAGSGGGGGSKGGDAEETDLPPPPPEANGRCLSLRVARHSSPSPSENASSSSVVVGVSNPGFWGVPVRPGDEFDLVAWLFVPSAKSKEGGEASSSGGVVVELLVPAASPLQKEIVAASAVLVAPSLDAWNKVEARLLVPRSGEEDTTTEEEEASTPFASARLVVRTPDESPPPPPPPHEVDSPSSSSPPELAFALAAVSLFPAANGPLGSVSPFRADLLQSLKKLNPRFLRVPGGCYVEGDTLADAFDWASTVREPLSRPGHWNGPWRYWSTDGLGIFEWLLLAEKLKAPAVWVQSAGVAHRESLPTWGGGGAALAESALAALEFALGDATSGGRWERTKGERSGDGDDSDGGGGGGGGDDDGVSETGKLPGTGSLLSSSPWASLRASVFNRSHPFPPLAALAIGNEDCGKPFYASNFAAIREAASLRFPGLPVVANCGDERELDADLFDWHFYSSADDVWAHRDVFSAISADPLDPASASAFSENGAAAFATEFAAFDWGIPSTPAGWLKGAVAEAGFMTGLENAAFASRSSAAVAGGSFAPALAHARGTGNCPTSLLTFDAFASFETPSFLVQELFANAAGRALTACSTSSSSSDGGGVAASASCERERCGIGEGEGGEDSSSSVFVKVVNYGPSTRKVYVAFFESVNGTRIPASLSPEAVATLLSHPDPAASNSFAFPTQIKPVEVLLKLDEQSSERRIVELEMPPYSLAVLKVERQAKERKERALAYEEQR